jgi:hypothetical protein
MDDLERIFRKWLLEEASGNGPAVTTTAGPHSVQRWPLGRGTDKAYWEVDDCD